MYRLPDTNFPLLYIAPYKYLSAWGHQNTRYNYNIVPKLNNLLCCFEICGETFLLCHLWKTCSML